MTPMTRTARRSARRHGLTLLELLLAVAVTSMVAAALSAMLGAVWTGVETRRDARSVMVHANAAQVRLATYIVPSRCILHVSGGDLILWHNDARESDTVHASEIRWLLFNEENGSIDLHFVRFPEEWSEPAQHLEDLEHPAGSNWYNVLSSYQAKGFTTTYTLIDALQDVSVLSDKPAAMNSRHVVYRIALDVTIAEREFLTSAFIVDHQVPVR
jgi:prepilin-type N-terminal cleavage/methylation domain-containing protein